MAARLNAIKLNREPSITVPPNVCKLEIKVHEQ